MEGVCCVYDEPNCIINMFLQPPWLPNYAPLQAPPGWQPVIYDSRQIPMPGQIVNPGIPQTHPDWNPNNVQQPPGPPPPGYGPMPGQYPQNDQIQPPGYGPNPVNHPDHPEESKSEVDSDDSDYSNKHSEPEKPYKVVDKGNGQHYLEIDEEVDVPANDRV